MLKCFPTLNIYVKDLHNTTSTLVLLAWMETDFSYLGRYPACLPTYPGVPQAVDITLSAPSIFDSPKSLIMILESSSML